MSADLMGTLSRRTVISVIGTAGAVGAMAATGVQRASAAPGASVAVLGGGVGGLTAAHELAERGFAVTVYERRALGGKARSLQVPGGLPGEHGFRFFPGFYHHLPDTMRRIGVWHNLVPASEVRFARRGRDDLRLPLSLLRMPTPNPEIMRGTLTSAFASALQMPAPECAHFVNRLLVYFTSCDARRFNQWENISWHSFVGAPHRSAEYYSVFSRALTSGLVAAKENIASARTIGNMGEQFLGNPGEVGHDGPLDRVLNGPTNETWLDPWTAKLRALGVRFVMPATVTGLDVSGKRIRAARLANGREITADYFVVAMPTDRARSLWTPKILELDPQLAGMKRLHMDWMNGIQFYLRRVPRLVHGHIAFVDSPWALTGLTQTQFWGNYLSRHGDGAVRDCLSIDISDWHTPGIIHRKPALECSPQEIAREVWAQVRAHLSDVGDQLHDDDLHSWAIDPGISWDARRKRNSNDDPLLINTAGSWQLRPPAHGAIENLFLAADYVRTDIDLATMEGANEAARAAVNALLDVAGSTAPRCRMIPLNRSPNFASLRQLDTQRHAAGLPNQFDV